MAELDAIVAEFLDESLEGLERLEPLIMALEDPGRSRADVDAVFRTLHSLKGTSSHLEFARLSALAHAGETLLDRFRVGERTPTTDDVDALLALVDALGTGLRHVVDHGDEPPVLAGELLARLTALAEEEGSGTAGLPEAPVAPEPEREEQAATRVRVDVDLLTEVMNLVGELVLTRNQMLQSGQHLTDEGLLDSIQRLDRVATELQDAVTSTRLQPISTLWDRLPRMVRSAARECGKQVQIVLQGAETELDRSLVEAFTDPLSHLVRNAIFHGIEETQERLAWGKPPAGQLTLSAHHEGSQVVIEIGDDGRGLDFEAIRRKAIVHGLMTADEAHKATPEVLQELIFSPGLSTAATVTDTAGRGVGLDVVRTRIERQGGHVEVATEVGEGTTFRIRVPLTLSIVTAIVLTCGGERFACPQESVQRLILVSADDRATRFEDLHGTPVMRLGGQLLPLVFLDRVLALRGDGDCEGDVFVVVVEARGRCFALVADEVVDTQEIVVKSLDQKLRTLSVYTGATILGDGTIALILDVMGLARAAGVFERLAPRHQAAEASEVPEEPGEPLLVVREGGRQLAVPLGQVQRLEVFPSEAVQWHGHQSVVRFQDLILPLVDLGRALGGAAPERVGGTLHVLVNRSEQGPVGFVVDEVLDIVSDVPRLTRPANRPGSQGALVLDDTVTEVVDLEALRGLVRLGPDQVSA